MSANTERDPEGAFRILMTADAVGGVWQYAADLTAGLAQRGAEILLATLGPRPSEAQKQQLSTSGVKLVESDYALEWMPNSWADVDAAGKWLLEHANSFDPDIIHLNGYAHAGLGWHKPVIVVAHSCVYSWWRAVHGYAPDAEWSEYKYRIEQGLAAADIVIAPSTSIAAAIRCEYNVPNKKFHIIHNFSRAPAVIALKEPFILAAGRLWDPAKNLSLLNQISSRLNWELCIAGSDHGPENSTASPNAVRFLGSLPHSDLMKEMGRAAIFAHPALYEPFGLSILEAARARCCLVLADIPSLRELWEDAAIFADPRDPEQWLFELNALSSDARSRESLAATAFAHAARYGVDAALNAYYATYRSLGDLKSGAKKETAA